MQTATAILSNLPEDVTSAAKGTLGEALAVAKQLPGQSGTVLLTTARESFVQSLRFSATVAAVLLITVAVVTAVLLGRAGMRKLQNENCSIFLLKQINRVIATKKSLAKFLVDIFPTFTFAMSYLFQKRNSKQKSPVCSYKQLGFLLFC